MKKNLKYLLIITLTIVGIFSTSGCSQDNMDNINIIVTSYPSEYIIKYLYGDHATITSIYPDGVDISKYKVSEKQKTKYAKEDLFIYNGLIERERDLALDLLSKNENLKIIDTAYVLETDYSPEELWLNPSSLLMMSQNVRIGLEEYIVNAYLKEEIDDKYDEMKVELSELDADYRVAIDNTSDKTIVVDNAALKFLEKFGLEVICIDADTKEKIISDVNNLIKAGKITYIYTFEGEDISDNAKEIINNYPDVKVQKLHKLDNLSDLERSEKKDYLTIMNENLELLKQELYQ